MHDFTPFPALLGGILIGLAASLYLFSVGRVAGISGIVGSLLRRGVPDKGTPGAFLLGLLAAGAGVAFVRPSGVESSWLPTLPAAAVAGLLVGFGTQLGGGCTSGHGVCGLSRFSARSLVATLAFMATGMITVFVVRHVVGGGP